MSCYNSSLGENSSKNFKYGGSNAVGILEADMYSTIFASAIAKSGLLCIRSLPCIKKHFAKFTLSLSGISVNSPLSNIFETCCHSFVNSSVSSIYSIVVLFETDEDFSSNILFIGSFNKLVLRKLGLG